MNRTFFLFLFVLFTLSSAAQSLRVMTYNIRLDTPNDGVNQWPKRADKVIALIQKYNPDIIGVQEALHHQLQDLLRSLPDYSYCGVGRDDGKEKGEYSAILFRNSQFGVLEQKTFWLSETPEIPGSKSWDAAIARVATTARFFDRKTTTEFTIINTHFDHIGIQAREMSAVYLRKYVQDLTLKNRNPIVLMGDFNSLPTESAYASIVATEPVQILIDSKPANDSAGTYCGFQVGGIECKPIDFIFLTDEWVVTSYKVITDNDGTYYPSDHLPVMAEVIFKL
jgi:endonuclease/exonuclease/phosphatase family metal-dependent hydrolase